MNWLLKIMIIDNNRTFGHYLSDFLQMNFACVVKILSGDEENMLDDFKKFSPDVLFLDVQSAEKKFMAYTKNFKACRRDVHIIWITSCDQPEYTQKAKDLGVVCCLSKDAITSNSVINLVRMVYRDDRVLPGPKTRQKD
jgi:DNA-binding NarL/FixJ family response regulator